MFCQITVLPYNYTDYSHQHSSRGRWLHLCLARFLLSLLKSVVLRLLKLNGCISRPQDIVLTRDDFLKSQEQRAVLSSIVQVDLVLVSLFVIG